MCHHARQTGYLIFFHCMHDLGDICAAVSQWWSRWSKDNFVDLILSFHLHVSSRARSEVARCVWQTLFPAESSPTLSGDCLYVIILPECLTLGILGPAFSPNFWSLV